MKLIRDIYNYLKDKVEFTQQDYLAMAHSGFFKLEEFIHFIEKPKSYDVPVVDPKTYKRIYVAPVFLSIENAYVYYFKTGIKPPFTFLEFKPKDGPKSFFVEQDITNVHLLLKQYELVNAHDVNEYGTVRARK